MNRNILLSFVLIALMQFAVATFLHAATSYTLSFPNPGAHYVKVGMSISGVTSDSIDVKMPVWIPGSYMVREFSKNVEGFKVSNSKGEYLPFRKINKNTWRVNALKDSIVHIQYDVYAFEMSVRTSFVDRSLAWLNGASIFMYSEEFKNQPSSIQVTPFPTWKVISTGLPAADSSGWLRRANHYDQLADCPIVIGNQEVITFDFQGIPHHIVMSGKATYNKDSLKTDFVKIVTACTAIFGSNPNSDYHFFIHHGSAGGGGLEHMNSSSLITTASVYSNPTAYKGLLSLVAHEYFHLWNVKRIRPLELGPFNYDEEVYTNQLWFFEGFTSFYDDYIVYKTGYSTRKEYLDLLTGTISTVLNTPGDAIESVAEASFDAWIKYYRRNENTNNASVSYYSKGAIIAAMLQLDFLSSSGGTKSLDDLMSYLYSNHFLKFGRGLTDAELQEAIEHVGGKKYDDFMKSYIFGTRPLPVADYLMKAGIIFKEKKPKGKNQGSLSVVLVPGKNVISQVLRGGTAWTYGLSAGDEIMAVGGKSGEHLQKKMNDLKSGDLIDVEILRGGEKMIISVEVLAPVVRDFEYEIADKMTPSQQIVFEKFLPIK